MYEYLVGVDEAGRGPLAGPISVGVAIVSKSFGWEVIPGVNDSKKLSEKNREAIFLAAKQLQKSGDLDFAVSMVSAKVIDKIGIVPAVNLAMNRALKRIEQKAGRGTKSLMEKNGSIYRTKKSKTLCQNSDDSSPIDWTIDQCTVLLDGGLKAPEQYMHQETIIKGDRKEKVIGLASIMAKVTRDRYMRRAATLPAYTPYDFSAHKGYGTKTHREAIQKYGLTDEHRKSFCKFYTEK